MEKNNKKITAISITLTFVILIGGISIFNIFSPTKIYSENENRYLEQYPNFTLNTLFDGSFIESFENAVTDQFIARDSWVGLKTQSELLIQKKDSGGVYFAKNNYLIEQFQSLQMTKDGKKTQYQANLEYINQFVNSMKDKNINIQTMLIPTASSILSDKLPLFAPELDQSKLISDAQKEIAGTVLDMTDTLKNHADEYIYYRNDHHWTSLGAYYVYKEWCEINGFQTHDLDWYKQEILSDSFFGTTFSKANLYSLKGDTMTAFNSGDNRKFTIEYNNDGKLTSDIFLKDNLKKKDKYPTYLNGNQALTKITGGEKNSKKLLIIKDSYANTFTTLAINDFEEVYMVDLRYYKQNLSALIEENSIDNILFLYNIKGFSEDTNLVGLNINNK